jgi:hypothetical protein
MTQPPIARLRGILVASLIVVLVHIPPLNEAAVALRHALVGWAADGWTRLGPRQADIRNDGRARQADARPASGSSALRWPEGVALDVELRFDALLAPPAVDPFGRPAPDGGTTDGRAEDE